jgi:hypothetical protein
MRSMRGGIIISFPQSGALAEGTVRVRDRDRVRRINHVAP